MKVIFVIRRHEMNDFETYEYVVAQKKTGKYALRKFILIICYIIYTVVLLSVAMLTRLAVPLLALTPLTLLVIIFFTWRYVNIEYEYSITSGEVTVSRILGGRSRKDMIRFRLRDCSMIAPLGDRMWREKAELFGANQTISALSSEDAADAYFAAFEDENGKKSIVYFEATEKAIKICRFYNPAATVTSKVSL